MAGNPTVVQAMIKEHEEHVMEIFKTIDKLANKYNVSKVKLNMTFVLFLYCKQKKMKLFQLLYQCRVKVMEKLSWGRISVITRNNVKCLLVDCILVRIKYSYFLCIISR